MQRAKPHCSLNASVSGDVDYCSYKKFAGRQNATSACNFEEDQFVRSIKFNLKIFVLHLLQKRPAEILCMLKCQFHYCTTNLTLIKKFTFICIQL